jgi:ABC-2 type transport system ATP-binding protein
MGINLQNIEKKFDGKSVLKDISIQIDFNQVYCILGSNGAGKSTLINIMCDLLKPDSGFLDFNKKTYQLDSLYIKQNTGLLSQYNTLIEELNTFDFLNFIGMIYKMNSNEILSQIEKLTSFFFEDRSNLSKPIKTYSLGMKRKVSLCTAFIHKPNYLFLDEPFANLDPATSDSLCNLINLYKNNHRCIIISSHDLLYVNKIATKIGVIDKGDLIFNDSLEIFNKEKLLSNDLNKYFKSDRHDYEVIQNLI